MTDEPTTAVRLTDAELFTVFAALHNSGVNNPELIARFNGAREEIALRTAVEPLTDAERQRVIDHLTDEMASRSVHEHVEAHVDGWDNAEWREMLEEVDTYLAY